jgi:Trk K+ transport system NAD-binding subunit
MSRPKPTILLEVTNKKTYKTEQVLEADAIWAVFYQDKPINLKTSSIVAQQLGPKYKKVSFSNAGHAHNLSEKLNKMFNTQDFAVFKLTTGKKIADGSED